LGIASGETVLNANLIIHVKREMVMVRKLILGTASVLALAIGAAALDFSADAGDVTNGSGKTASMPHHWIDAANLSKDDVRWAQLELRNIGLYNGSLDGVIGPETKRALAGFQKSNGLQQTTTLDQQTADTLIGNTGEIGHGSSLPPKREGAAATTTNTSGANYLGK